MAAGYRCEAGCASWPDEERYTTCPICDEPTRRFRNLQEVLTPEEATMARFEVYYNNQHEPALTLTPEESQLVEASLLAGMEEYRARGFAVSPLRIDPSPSSGAEAIAVSS